MTGSPPLLHCARVAAAAVVSSSAADSGCAPVGASTAAQRCHCTLLTAIAHSFPLAAAVPLVLCSRLHPPAPCAPRRDEFVLLLPGQPHPPLLHAHAPRSRLS